MRFGSLTGMAFQQVAPLLASRKLARALAHSLSGSGKQILDGSIPGHLPPPDDSPPYSTRAGRLSPAQH